MSKLTCLSIDSHVNREVNEYFNPLPAIKELKMGLLAGEMAAVAGRLLGAGRAPGAMAIPAARGFN